MSITFIKDPIHGNIDFSKDEKWALEIIDTNEFKRLQSITQLGECPNVFYSAKHTRFAHSIGVFYLAKQFLNSLNIKNVKQRNVVLAAALLHDIGHGPKSHSFELYVGLKHEAMTIKIISNKKGEINKILNKYKINIKEVIDIIEKKHKNKWMTQIVSSQIDADRLDYLLRDSYHSGVTYGKSVDYSFLFKKISIHKNELVYDKKVINLIETILFARYQMFQQLYTNIHVLCYEAIITKVFSRWKILHQQGFKFNDEYQLYYLFDAYLNNKSWKVDNFLALDENKYSLILKSLQNENDKQLQKLLNSYFNNNLHQLVISNNQQYDYCLKSKDFYNIKEPIHILDDKKISEISTKSSIIKDLCKPTKENKYLLTNKKK